LLAHLPNGSALLNLRQCDSHQCGAIAQLGERVVRNDEAIGSIPISSTKKHHLIEQQTLWMMRTLRVWTVSFSPRSQLFAPRLGCAFKG
jgi:hypothetical protein